jgi:cell division protease FtsH
MSPALSLSLTNPICKSQALPKSTNRENPCQKTPSDIKLSRRKLLNSTGLGLVGGGLSVAQPARAEPESPVESTSSRMSYSRFLQYLDKGAVEKVDLFENGTVAIAKIFNPTLDKIQRVKIQLPGLPRELLRKMEEKNVDFAAHPMEINQGPAILDLLGNFAFPLILLGSFLLRTSSTNTPGGPNLPFGLGRYSTKKITNLTNLMPISLNRRLVVL